MVRKSKKTAKWQYLGETDPAQFVWSNKTHRTVSEAFRDANYAYSGYKPKSEWEDFVDFCSGFLFVLPVIILCLYVLYLIVVGRTN